eukprot:246266-Lingulodinium_polyedra.AAC.1
MTRASSTAGQRLRGGPLRRPGPRKAAGLRHLAAPRPAGPCCRTTRTAVASPTAAAPMTKGTAG